MSGPNDPATVTRVQEELKRRGYDPGPADGVLGPQTREAIKRFQKDSWLKQTGEVDTDLLVQLGLLEMM